MTATNMCSNFGGFRYSHLVKSKIAAARGPFSTSEFNELESYMLPLSGIVVMTNTLMRLFFHSEFVWWQGGRGGEQDSCQPRKLGISII